MNVNNKIPRHRNRSIDSSADSYGILDERILLLVFESINWDPHVLCLTACVSRKLHAIAKRVLWRELCLSRAPKMVSVLAKGSSNDRIGGGWDALGRLLFFCCGCVPSLRFRLQDPLPGHFAETSRFSKTSGRSFLTKKCEGDLLYVSDPCEHITEGNDDILGVYRGVFKGFSNSKTRSALIRRQIGLEDRVKCPYCGARVWSMTSARLVPRNASKRLGSHQGSIEYFVCVNGHLHGSCWLVPLSSDENVDVDDYDEDGDDEDDNGVVYGEGSSSGEVVGQDALSHLSKCGYEW